MMDRFVIDGGRPLFGTVEASGSKNATLPLMAAAILAPGITEIEGAPRLADIDMMGQVMVSLGAEIRKDGRTISVDTTKLGGWEAPYDQVRKMRASFYVLGPLLAKFGRGRVSLPGGCALGPRPVDLHLKALEKLGCKIELDGGYVVASAEKLRGTRIVFDTSSVGATGNVMMAAVAAEGITTIENAAREPEIVDLADMLCKMGAQITGQGGAVIKIKGPTQLKAVNWKVIPDRIETGTFLIAVAACGGDVTITNARPDHLDIVIDKLIECGTEIEPTDDSIHIRMGKRPRPASIKTDIYPGFPTDLQAPWTSLMCLADGDSSVIETIYPERFNHVPELQRLGGSLRKELNSLHIRGVEQLKGAHVMCSDIRAGAGMVIATVAAKGKSDLLRVYHLDRGYESLEARFSSLGAKIARVKD